MKKSTRWELVFSLLLKIQRQVKFWEWSTEHLLFPQVSFPSILKNLLGGWGIQCPLLTTKPLRLLVAEQKKINCQRPAGCLQIGLDYPKHHSAQRHNHRPNVSSYTAQCWARREGEKEIKSVTHFSQGTLHFLVTERVLMPANDHIQFRDPILDAETFSTLQSWVFFFTRTWKFDYLLRVKQERARLCG